MALVTSALGLTPKQIGAAPFRLPYTFPGNWAATVGRRLQQSSSCRSW